MAEWDRVERRKDNWTLLVKEYYPKIGFRYKNDHGEYVFFGLVLADDDYYYGMMSTDGQMTLATCVGALDRMYKQIPNGGRCDLCNCVYPESGPEKCDRYRCPQGSFPLESPERCPHGVWKADHCWACNPEKQDSEIPNAPLPQGGGDTKC